MELIFMLNESTKEREIVEVVRMEMVLAALPLMKTTTA